MSAVFINGSLRGRKATTTSLLKALERELGSSAVEAMNLQIRARPDGGFTMESFVILKGAKAIVIAFPLFVYCLPGALMAFMENWYLAVSREGRAGMKTRVYAIVNSGHAEPEINTEAIRVIANFCRRTGFDFRFAIAVGCGPLVKATIDVPLIGSKARKAIASMASDIVHSDDAVHGTILVRPPLPKRLIFWIRDTFFLNKAPTES
jgi:hypothetical protein